MIPDTFMDFIGVWVAAILTLCVYSFLVKDNFMFKLTEAIFVGVSVGYFIVISYQNGVKPKIQDPLKKYFHNISVDTSDVTNSVFCSVKDFVNDNPNNGTGEFVTNNYVKIIQNSLNDASTSLELSHTNIVAANIKTALKKSSLNFSNKKQVLGVTENFLKNYSPISLKKHFWALYIFLSLCLGLLFLSRFFPKHAWLSRFPMAYTIGIGAGIAVPLSIQSQILAQLQATFVPVVMYSSGGVNWGITFGNIVLLIGVFSVLYYFFFSLKKEDKISQGLTKVGIAYLMVGFGASFAFTIMARISLLIGRVEFLKEDWITGTLKYFGM